MKSNTLRSKSLKNVIKTGDTPCLVEIGTGRMKNVIAELASLLDLEEKVIRGIERRRAEGDVADVAELEKVRIAVSVSINDSAKVVNSTHKMLMSLEALGTVELFNGATGGKS